MAAFAKSTGLSYKCQRYPRAKYTVRLGFCCESGPSLPIRHLSGSLFIPKQTKILTGRMSALGRRASIGQCAWRTGRDIGLRPWDWTDQLSITRPCAGSQPRQCCPASRGQAPNPSQHQLIEVKGARAIHEHSYWATTNRDAKIGLRYGQKSPWDS